MSTHNALQHIKNNWTGTTWFIEGDIKGCFDTIDHHILIEILQERIQDERFIRLIWKALRAGYLEFKIPTNNFTGTPQGSIVSPVLANIYLHKFDEFIGTLKEKYERQAEKRTYTREYADHQNTLRRLRRKWNKVDGIEKEKILQDIHLSKIQLTTHKVFENDSMDIRIKYVRYADDFLKVFLLVLLKFTLLSKPKTLTFSNEMSDYIRTNTPKQLYTGVVQLCFSVNRTDAIKLTVIKRS